MVRFHGAASFSLSTSILSLVEAASKPFFDMICKKDTFAGVRAVPYHCPTVHKYPAPARIYKAKSRSKKPKSVFIKSMISARRCARFLWPRVMLPCSLLLRAYSVIFSY